MKQISKVHLLIFLGLWLLGDILTTWAAINMGNVPAACDTSPLAVNFPMFVIGHVIIALAFIAMYFFIKVKSIDFYFGLVLFGLNSMMILVVSSNLSSVFWSLKTMMMMISTVLIVGYATFFFTHSKLGLLIEKFT